MFPTKALSTPYADSSGIKCRRSLCLILQAIKFARNTNMNQFQKEGIWAPSKAPLLLPNLPDVGECLPEFWLELELLYFRYPQPFTTDITDVAKIGYALVLGRACSFW